MTQLQIEDLVEEIVGELQGGPINEPPTSEREFEQNFVEGVCVGVIKARAGEWERAVHPWGDKTKEAAWRISKAWGAVEAWGMRHTLDLVARDAVSEVSLGVEVKLARIQDGRAPTGDFQRMIGQCLLGRLRHKAMIGVFGYLGDIKRPVGDTTEDYRRKLQQEHGIWVVVRRVGDSPAASGDV